MASVHIVTQCASVCVHVLQLIRVCSEHGQAVTALSVYEWMKAPAALGGAGLAPTVYTYTAAMRAALAAGLLDRALQIWEDAQTAECPLDCRLCITYIEVGGSSMYSCYGLPV